MPVNFQLYSKVIYSGIDAAAVSNSGDSPLRVAGRTSAKITEMLIRYFSKP